MKPPKGLLAGFWISTILFALQMGFTAYAQLRLPQVAAAFVHFGFPPYFRIELSWAKFAGLAVLLIPAVPARLKEWAYAGFAFTLVSAVIAHLAVGDGPSAWSWAAGTGVLWALSYYFFRRLIGLRSRRTSASSNLSPDHFSTSIFISAQGLDQPEEGCGDRHPSPLELTLP